MRLFSKLIEKNIRFMWFNSYDFQRKVAKTIGGEGHDTTTGVLDAFILRVLTNKLYYSAYKRAYKKFILEHIDGINLSIDRLAELGVTEHPNGVKLCKVNPKCLRAWFNINFCG